MKRWQAFAIHLGISLLIFGLLASLVLFAWYPDFFFTTDGGWQGIRIIGLVDLVLGPLLTLVVYRAGKPGLKLDLTLIGIFQGICLTLGTYVVYSERPLALVYSDGQFNSLTADEFQAIEIDPSILQEFPGRTPQWLMVALPEDPVVQSAVRRDAMQSKTSTALLVDYYQPFDLQHPLVTMDSVPLAELRAQDDKYSNELLPFLAARDYSAEDLRFYPYAARFSYFYLAFDRSTGEFVDLLRTIAPH